MSGDFQKASILRGQAMLSVSNSETLLRSWLLETRVCVCDIGQVLGKVGERVRL